MEDKDSTNCTENSDITSAVNLDEINSLIETDQEEDFTRNFVKTLEDVKAVLNNERQNISRRSAENKKL